MLRPRLHPAWFVAIVSLALAPSVAALPSPAEAITLAQRARARLEQATLRGDPADQDQAGALLKQALAHMDEILGGRDDADGRRSRTSPGSQPRRESDRRPGAVEAPSRPRPRRYRLDPRLSADSP